MPTYEYACKDCGDHLEVVQAFRDDALTECPQCQGTLRKVFSAAGIIFKGSGWHVKDYASPARASGGSSAQGTGAGAEGTSSGSEKTPGTDTDSASSSSTPASKAETKGSTSSASSERESA